jgi:vacuolar protein sorting-associated protein IST1
MKKLTVETPEPTLVEAYLGEIARGYSIDWTPASLEDNLDEDNDGEGGNKVRNNLLLTHTIS